MKNGKRILLLGAVLLSGASVMVYELAVPRLFAPIIGTSTYVWTTVIGVVMASLSLGYFWGGNLSRRKPEMSVLTMILLSAAGLMLLVSFYKDTVLIASAMRGWGKVSSSLILSIVLMMPVNTLLGMVTPLAVYLLTENKEGAGTAAGNVFAVSTLGSIIGTFAAGYYLIPTFGVHAILMGVTMALLLAAVLTMASRWGRMAVICIAGLSLLAYGQSDPAKQFAKMFERGYMAKLVAEQDTQYSRVWIYEVSRPYGQERWLSDGQSWRVMGESVSEMMEREISYLNYFGMATKMVENPQRVLLIGGGAYTFPGYLLENKSELIIDVVEIDGELLAVAREYFGFEGEERINNFAMDGRVFLNQNRNKYDLIYLDAYQKDNTIPFQLVTVEAFERMKNSLREDGVLAVNLIAAVEGEQARLFEAQFRTMERVFGELEVYLVNGMDPTSRQNVIVLAGEELRTARVGAVGGNVGRELLEREYQVQEGEMGEMILTDNYAPVEYLDLQREK